MVDLYAALVEKFGEPKGPRIPRTDADRKVKVTPEFLRIQRLPWRDWAVAPDLEAGRVAVSNALKTPIGQQQLRPVQAAALREIHNLRGGFLPIRVGGGKTLISLLVAHALILDAKRPVLFVPAALREKTKIEARRLAFHWQVSLGVRVFSYEQLSRAKPGWLDTCCDGLPPDLVIADECHKLKNTSAGCTKAMRAFMRKHTPDKGEAHVPFVAMSGSITARGLRDYRHILVWCLGEHAPVPRDAFEAMIWGLALDEKVDPEQRADPGPLETLLEGSLLDPDFGAKDALQRARIAYGLRLVHSYGVITTAEDIPQVGLTLSAVHVDAPPKIREAIQSMRETWCSPIDEWPFESTIEMWQHANEMAGGGFCHVWDPRPPRPWLERRKAWAKFCREALQEYKSLHTPMHVVQAIHAGRIDDGGVYAEWQQIKPTFEPNTVPVPIDDTTLQVAADWLKKHHSEGLVWVSHRYTGRRLQEMTGVPYFHAKAENDRGELVDLCKTSAIVSVHSCREGRNLQRWNANLVLVPPTVGSWWEQMLGRTHRDGQEADDVTCEVPLMIREQYEALAQAIRDAEYTQHTTKMPQKLVYADKDLPDLNEAIKSGQLL